MKHYIELTILADPEISPYFIWQKLYTQLHLALVEHAKATYGENATHGDIGVSFPAYKYQNKASKDNGNKEFGTLGNKLRIFADSEDTLKKLDLHTWLERLTDYVHIKSVQAVPNEHSFVTVSRARQVKNLDQIARRRAKRQKTTFDKAKANIIADYQKKNDVSYEKSVEAYHNPTLKAYPYITTKSLSGKQGYPLEIKQTETTQGVKGQAVTGTFNTYGLSAKNTVPHW